MLGHKHGLRRSICLRTVLYPVLLMLQVVRRCASIFSRDSEQPRPHDRRLHQLNVHGNLGMVGLRHLHLHGAVLGSYRGRHIVDYA